MSIITYNHCYKLTIILFCFIREGFNLSVLPKSMFKIIFNFNIYLKT